MEQEVVKKYVKVVAVFSPEGTMLPLCVVWEDGRKFDVDRVKQCVRAASRKAGGVGLRYTCMIRGKEAVLYYEENYKWFVEAKVQRG